MSAGRYTTRSGVSRRREAQSHEEKSYDSDTPAIVCVLAKRRQQPQQQSAATLEGRHRQQLAFEVPRRCWRLRPLHRHVGHEKLSAKKAHDCNDDDSRDTR